jgi:microcin C transport system permease protein
MSWARARAYPSGVLMKHVFRNALIPIVTGFRRRSSARFRQGVAAGTCIRSTGSACWVRSLVRRDYPVVLGTLFFTLIGLVVKHRRPALRRDRSACRTAAVAK